MLLRRAGLEACLRQYPANQIVVIALEDGMAADIALLARDAVQTIGGRKAIALDWDVVKAGADQPLSLLLAKSARSLAEAGSDYDESCIEAVCDDLERPIGEADAAVRKALAKITSAAPKE
jgi:hypothetical protein